MKLTLNFYIFIFIILVSVEQHRNPALVGKLVSKPAVVGEQMSKLAVVGKQVSKPADDRYFVVLSKPVWKPDSVGQNDCTIIPHRHHRPLKNHRRKQLKEPLNHLKDLPLEQRKEGGRDGEKERSIEVDWEKCFGFVWVCLSE